MADVVICCAGEDRETARLLDEALSRAGYRVWWDEAASSDFWHSDAVVDRIGDAGAAVAIWSDASAASGLFRAEANAARGQGKLIQALANGRTPPTPFDLLPAASLAGWRGEESHAGWQTILRAVETLCGGSTSAAPAASSSKSAPPPAPALVPKPAPARTGMGSTRLVDALLPLLILAAIGAGAMGWMNGSAAAFGERAPALPSTPVAEAPQAVLSAAKPVRLAEAAPPPPAPAPAPAPVAPVLPPQEMSSAETREEARSADERPRETRQAARKRKAAAEAASKRKKALAERKAPRPKVKYRYSENMRLFCEKAGAATPECKTFRRNTAKRRRA